MEADIYGKRLCLDPWGKTGAVSRVIGYGALKETFRITFQAFLQCALSREPRLAQTQVTPRPLARSSHYQSRRHRLCPKITSQFWMKMSLERFKDLSASVCILGMLLPFRKYGRKEKTSRRTEHEGSENKCLKISTSILLDGKTALEIINKLPTL